jgi:hypothetical protein
MSFEKKLIEDNREAIVEEGDENNAYLPRFILIPFASSLSIKKPTSEVGEDDGKDS